MRAVSARRIEPRARSQRARAAHRWWVLLAACSAWMVTALPETAWALSAAQARSSAGTAIASVESQVGSIRRVSADARRVDPSRLVAAGELHFRTKDYDQAIDQLNKVVELDRRGQVTEAVAADATFLLAESYFASGQLHSAGRYYELITDRADRAAYAPFAGRAAGRLVDVALQTRQTDALDSILARVNRLAPSDPTGSLQFARAKTLFAKGDLQGAQQAAASVPASSEYAHRAAYLRGVALTKEALAAAESASADSAASAQGLGPSVVPDYTSAIQEFQRTTQLAATNPEQQHVVDLAWMAIGRLLYERGAYLDAADAYTKVQRSSPEFTTALYELGWTYVRLGDYERGQRSLELLSVLDPSRIDAADGALLRADVLLRSGRFEQALQAYYAARDEYDPLQKQVAAFLEKHQDPADYYDVLTADEIEVGGELPAVAIEWAREEAAEDRMFAVTDDVARTRRLVKRSRHLIAQLQAVLASPSRAKMFPEVSRELETTLGLLNQLALARRQLAEGMDDEAGREVGGELAQVRAERRRLMARLGEVPVYPADFNKRKSQTEQDWNAVSQELQRLTLRTDYLQAMVNGLRRVLADAERFEVTANPAARARFEEEILSNEQELVAHRQRIEQLRQQVEMGRAQIGIGDEKFVEDDKVRGRFRELFAREVELVAAGGDERDAVDYAKSIQPLLRRADAAAAALERARSALEGSAESHSRDVLALVARENEAMNEYAARLEELDQNARVLLGEMAMRNLELVRQRLKNVVQRADVGIVQHAWELREEQIHRVRELQRERAREERYLNDELREVLDDAEDTP